VAITSLFVTSTLFRLVMQSFVFFRPIGRAYCYFLATVIGFVS